MFKKLIAALALSTAIAAPAYAQDEESGDLTISGSAALTTQYRFRGISQTDEDPAIQGGITIGHSSGFYVGTWASNLAGFGSFGGANMELDAIGGFSTDVGGVTLDAGLIWYIYPGTSGTDFGEIYASAAAPLGPVTAKAGAYYAPADNSIGGEDNLYLFTDWAAAIPDTPLTLKAHLGYTTGNGSALAGPDGDYLDYSIGADLTYKNLTLNVSYVDTDIDEAAADAYYTVPGGRLGRDIAGGAVVATLTATF